MIDWNDYPNFAPEEFTCSCGCAGGPMEMSIFLLNKLQDLRTKLGFPFVVTSGFRCYAHNATVGGVENSAHTKGEAADISIGGSSQRFRFLRSAIFSFDRVGVYPTFIHVDVSTTLPQDVCWMGA